MDTHSAEQPLKCLDIHSVFKICKQCIQGFEEITFKVLAGLLML